MRLHLHRNQCKNENEHRTHLCRMRQINKEEQWKRKPKWRAELLLINVINKMSNNFWSGLGGITQLAAGAINKAKEQIRDIANESIVEEPIMENNSTKEKIERLESRCREFKRILQDRDEELYENKKQLDILIDQEKQHLNCIEDLKEDNKEIVKFRIVIGAEDSAEVLEMLENTEKELEVEKSLRVEEKLKLMEILLLKENELTSERTKNQELTADIDKARRSLQEFGKNEVILVDENERLKNANGLHEVEIMNLKEKLQETHESLNSLQDSLLTSKRNLHKTVEECYRSLKMSGLYIGLTTPSIKPESLGIEDIQEFLLSQSEYMKETITRVATSLSLKTKGATNKKIVFKQSLEGIREGIFAFIEQIANKIKEYQEITKTTEEMYHKTLKEKLDLEHKIDELSMLLKQKDESILFLESEIGKEKADFQQIDNMKLSLEKLARELDESKSSTEKLQFQLDESNGTCKRLEENYKSLENHFTSLIQKQKTLNTELDEKDHTVKELLSQIEKLKQQVIELESLSAKKINDIESQLLSRIRDLEIKHNEETGDFNSKHSKIQFDLQLQLGKAQNEIKELKNAKAQIEKYEEAIRNLQELLQSLEKQTENYSHKIDDLNTELETTLSKLSHVTSVKRNYKQKLGELEVQFEAQRDEFKIEKVELEKQIQHTQQMKHEAEALVNQVQKQIQDTENLIDRRLITTFLINYLNEANSDKVRYQMLKALAGMLELDSEQKQKIGLVQDEGLLAQFVGFLSKG